MKTIFWIKLTKPEIEHINSLIKMNEEEGTYYSPKNQYWSRSARIRKKLDDISRTCNMFQCPPRKSITTHDLTDLDQQRDDYYNRPKLLEH